MQPTSNIEKLNRDDNSWQPDLDPDYGSPVSQYPAPPQLSPIAPGQPLVAAAQVTPQPIKSPLTLNPGYQPGGPRQYAWVQPRRTRQMRTERQEVQMWTALIGVTFAPALWIFGNLGGEVCIALWLAFAVWQRFLSGTPRPRLLGVELSNSVLVIIALLGFIFYLFFDNGLFFRWDTTILFALLCIICWVRLRYSN